MLNISIFLFHFLFLVHLDIFSYYIMLVLYERTSTSYKKNATWFFAFGNSGWRWMQQQYHIIAKQPSLRRTNKTEIRALNENMLRYFRFTFFSFFSFLFFYTYSLNLSLFLLRLNFFPSSFVLHLNFCNQNTYFQPQK